MIGLVLAWTDETPIFDFISYLVCAGKKQRANSSFGTWPCRSGWTLCYPSARFQSQQSTSSSMALFKLGKDTLDGLLAIKELDLS